MENLKRLTYDFPTDSPVVAWKWRHKAHFANVQWAVILCFPGRRRIWDCHVYVWLWHLRHVAVVVTAYYRISNVKRPGYCWPFNNSKRHDMKTIGDNKRFSWVNCRPKPSHSWDNGLCNESSCTEAACFLAKCCAATAPPNAQKMCARRKLS